MIVLLVALGGGTAPARSQDVKLGEFIPLDPPQPAPAIVFTDLQGKPAALADFKGRAVLVNLWATWCQPCLEEMPSLLQLEQSLGGAVTVAAVSEDHGGAAVVAPFIAKHDLGGLAVYLDPDSAAIEEFNARGLPTTILIDPDGRMLGKVEGAAKWGSDAMRAALKPLLPPAPAAR